jgi:lipopolysaccharide transport system ATP-binding protein
MSNIVIQAENISKQYRLGKVGRKSLHDDINRWMHKLAGKEDPYLQVGDVNDRTVKASSDYVWALQDVSFSVNQGEVLGVLGRNGAGKSTLLKILSKVTAPTRGSIKIKGRIASLLEVGTGFHPELSGRDNIFLNGAILGMTRKEIQSKFDEIVAFAGVERYIDTPVKRYSSGMYVRLAFAVAAHLEPDILIVDEVLAVGDAEFQKKCLGKMKDVSTKDGRTILFVSHNMPAILNLCNKAMVLEFGRSVYAGETEASVQFYLNNKRPQHISAIVQRTDRLGSGAIICTNLSLLNSKNETVESVKSGDGLQFKVDYELTDKPVRTVYFRIQIADGNEAILFTCNNEHTNGTIDIIEKSGSIICSIPRLPLFGGAYYINVQIFSREQGLLDEVESAKEFSVVDGDFFGTGRIPVVKKGMLIEHNWQIND